MKWLPNALSATRALLAFPIAVFALEQKWPLAFSLLAVAILTDSLDGTAARILNAETKFGKDWLDPLCDGIMAGGAMWGLMFQRNAGNIVAHLAFLMLLVGIPLKVLKHQNRFPRFRKMAMIMLPLCYIITMAVVVNIYCYRAFDGSLVGIWITMVALPVGVFTKKERFAGWLSDQR